MTTTGVYSDVGFKTLYYSYDSRCLDGAMAH